MEVTMKDGKLVVNDLEITPYFPTFEGVSLPKEFITFFLNPQTKDETVLLIRETAKTFPQTRGKTDGCKLVFNAAVKGGLSAGWQMFETLQAAKPNGKPQFYRSYDSKDETSIAINDDESEIVLTDGTDAYKFSTRLNIESLPQNVYCPEENVRLTLTKDLLNAAKLQTDELFRLAKKLIEMHGHSYRVKIGETLKAFLTDHKLADAMMADAELWINFLHAALKCPQGYLTYKDESMGWERGYLVTPTGEVYVFSVRGENALAETVTLAVRQGVPIKNLRREHLTDDERVKISKAIVSINAAIPLLLLP